MHISYWLETRRIVVYGSITYYKLLHKNDAHIKENMKKKPNGRKIIPLTHLETFSKQAVTNI